MRRVVLDTNVIVSALVFGGAPLLILEQIFSREIVGVSSPVLIEELLRTLRTKFGYAEEVLNAIARRMNRRMKVVVSKKRVRVLADAADNRVLEAAVVGDCDTIVTGDKAMVALGSYRGIKIMNVREFLDEMDAER